MSKTNTQKLIEIAMTEYGLNKKTAKIYITTLNNTSKQLLLNGFYKNAKKCFVED